MSVAPVAAASTTANKRSKFQRIADRMEIAKWKSQGHTECECQELLAAIRPYRLARASIHKDVEVIEREWRLRAAVDIESAKGRQLAILERQQVELWSAWEKSKQDMQTQRVKGTPTSGEEGAETGKITPTEVLRTKAGQCGDPRYMQLILDIQTRISKLLGLDAPETLDLTSKGDKLAGTQLIHVNIDLGKI